MTIEPGTIADQTVTHQADREQTAGRLLQASARHSYDPVTEIDWEAPLVPDLFFLPPHRSSLYGTTLWEGLSHQQRVELTKQEVASLASLGIWFETILMQMLVRHFYDPDPTSRHAQYALTEIADECRHSIMFARMIEKFGCRPYRVGRTNHLLGRLLKTTASGPHMFSAILIAEEVLDALQRETAADETVQPLVRMVSRIHVVEEARHVRYAREELARQVEMAGPARLAYSRLLIGRAAYLIAGGLTHPRVYATLGIDPARGRAAARANPRHQQTLRWAGQRITSYLAELGLIAGPARTLWQRSGLL
jgi:hypothetical protein